MIEQRKPTAMNSTSRAIVHHLIASQLRIDEASIEDAAGLSALGLYQLELVLVVLRLGDLHGRDGDLLLTAVASAATVGELVAAVDLWRQREKIPSSVAGPSSQRT